MQKGNAKRFWIALILFSLIGQVAWVVENMYFNVFIYKMFNASADQIATMVTCSAVIATLTTILIGALSDQVGRRKIFISLGYILWGLSILGFSFVRVDLIGAMIPTATSVSAICVTITIILDCVMTFFGSTANDACFNAWLTDVTEESNRGKVEGVNAMMPLVAILVVFGGFMSFDLALAESWTAIFAIIGIVVLLIGVMSFFLIKETLERHEGNEQYFKNILYGFRPSTVRSNVVLYLTILAFAVFGISIQIFMPYLIIYYEVSLALENYVLIMAPAIILAAIATAIYGRYYDKVGFTRSVIPSLAALCLGYVILGIFTNVALVFIGSLLMMTGYLTGMAVFGAMIRDYTPIGKAGAFQGLRIVGQVLIPGLIGPAVGAAVLRGAETMINSDGTESFIPNQNIFWAALVVIAVVLAVVFVLNRCLNKKSAGKINNSETNLEEKE